VIGGSLTPVPGIAAQLEVLPTTHDKCVRCWHFRADVGSHSEHPELCGRCVDNVDGNGETRRWF
jgi:isoleucyl-tRNA synthetase